jgi:lipopolysaccharide heptosyltransferase II
MIRENAVTVAMAQLAAIPFRLRRRGAFLPPEKVLILKPCCLSQVMLTTPLLAVMHSTYPRAQFDWAVSEWARPAVATNPRLSKLISSGRVGLPDCTWAELREFVACLQREGYDTCLIPSRSSLLSLVAWMARIPQRVGLNVQGRGFAHTWAVRSPAGEVHEAAVYLSLAEAVGADTAQGRMEFYPGDSARTAVTQRLVDEIDWLGDVPLVIMHPGGGVNPVQQVDEKRWPIERFARLGNYLARTHKARILLVGSQENRPLADAVAGLMPTRVYNLSGRLSLGQIGALCEVADLYVGNDAGPTHVAAAVGCPTLAVFGPSDPAVSRPIHTKGRVVTLWHEVNGKGFSWNGGVTADEGIEAAEGLLQQGRKSGKKV